jgi:hypothetical protein
MSQFTIYQSTDSSAPVLSGTNGALITVLDAVLVNGYGSKAAAGWTKAFTGTNKAAYRMGGGNQFYLRVLDTGPGADAAREARCWGYETMSDIDNGTVLFPNPLQLSSGVIFRKSFSADATARAWIIFADDRTFYAFFATNDGGTIYIGYMFGDFYSAIPNDPGRTMIIGGSVEANASSQPFTTVTTINGTIAGHFAARDNGAVRSSPQLGKHGDAIKGSSIVMDGQLRNPHPTDSLYYLSPMWLHDPVAGFTQFSIRGMMRGLYEGLFPVASVTHGDTFSGVMNGEAKSFRVVSTVRGGGSVGYVVIETSDTLATNPY